MPKQPVREDAALFAAEETARQAAVDISRATSVGDHLGVSMVDTRLAAHRFACLDAGYPGWFWEVTVSRAPRSKSVSVCEVSLIPGDEALLAPRWVPWDERLQPGDVSREDVLPYNANDSRLVSGFEQTDDDADRLEIPELGLGRPRVLSAEGIDLAAERWYASDRGPTPGAKPSQTCSSCGFLLRMTGSLGQLFGVCANEWSPDDGTVVSLDHACGAHSETDESRRPPQFPVVPPRMDDFSIDYSPAG